MIVPEIWVKAEQETEERCRQIQGFTTAVPGDKNRHYIRDVGQGESQLRWLKIADRDAYWETHEEMMRNIRLFQVELIGEAYARLVSEK